MSTPNKTTQKDKKRLIQFTHPDIIPMWICTFIDIIGYSILIPFLPKFSSDYGASLLQVGLLLSANSFFSLFGNVIWGSLSDKFGRKPILLICQFGTFAGFLLLATWKVPSWAVVLLLAAAGILFGSM